MIYEDIIDILGEYKKCIPSKVLPLKEPVPESNITEDRAYVTTLLVGIICLLLVLVVLSTLGGHQSWPCIWLDAIVPVAEDWHAKVCLLGVLIDGFLIHNYTTLFVHNAGPLHAPKKNPLQVNFNIWW